VFKVSGDFSEAGQTTLPLSVSQLPHHKTLKSRFTMRAQRLFQK